jgi:hypothetical protein
MDTLNANWWYEFNGEHKGPVNEEEIVKLINLGVVKSENLVWKQGTEHWVQLKNSPFSENFKNDKPPPITGDAVNNTLVWWLAFAPLIGQVLEGFFLELFYPEPKVDYDNINSIENYTHYLTHTNFNAFWFVTLALNFYLSFQDEKKLQKAGYDTGKLGSTFLIPVYLFKRAEMLKQNNAYFWVWLILFILTLIA